MRLILHVLHIQVVPSSAINYTGTVGLFAGIYMVNIGSSILEQEQRSQSYLLSTADFFLRVNIPH